MTYGDDVIGGWWDCYTVAHRSRRRRSGIFHIHRRNMLHKHTRYRLIAGGVWQVELMWWAGSVRVGFTWALGRVPAVYVKERYYALYLCNTQMIEFEANTLTERFNNVQRHKNSVVVPNFLTIIHKYLQTTAKTKRQYSHLRTATTRRIQKKVIIRCCCFHDPGFPRLH